MPISRDADLEWGRCDRGSRRARSSGGEPYEDIGEDDDRKCHPNRRKMKRARAVFAVETWTRIWDADRGAHRLTIKIMIPGVGMYDVNAEALIETVVL
ncbi:hypothetical protein EW146_g8417 [Bondarzewia mesenterica]|uniref:Uncharacterized protein n=1 Tax=Bondarzewia mesenterica TaxID=1095465 RepID=A0A4S4LEI9_9AGAM|nr:hypothetical protein EW146_g8417 [Bondarzewia mesenterica]